MCLQNIISREVCLLVNITLFHVSSANWVEELIMLIFTDSECDKFKTAKHRIDTYYFKIIFFFYSGKDLIAMNILI